MNFILECDNILSDNVCDQVIKLFESHPELQNPGGTSLGINEDWKKDTEISLSPDFFAHPEWGPVMRDVLSSLSSGIDQYKKQFTIENPDKTSSGINAIQSWRIDWVYNIQRYLPGEGYYVWHCETPSKESSSRVLVWMFYLNDVTDGGGTQFQFQDYTCKARKGKLVMWPSYWTHYHRGEVSLTQTKYIITGWASFI